MNRVVAVLIAVLMLAPMLAFAPSLGTPQVAKAEAGCSLSGDVNFDGGNKDAIGFGTYNCGTDVAANYGREFQVCLERNGKMLVCSYRDNLSNTSWRITVTDTTCSWTADLWQYRMWMWFYGEDGSVDTEYSPYRNSYLLC